jgi:LysM repeat protein
VIPNLPETTVPEPTYPTITHTVAAGETLYLIANKYKTTVAAIRDSNKLSNDIINIGQVLTIPMAQTEPATIPPRETAPSQDTTYVVVPGDTLSLIAKKFNTTTAAIKERNQLTTDMILVGQSLFIPANTVPVPPPPPEDTVAPVLENINLADKIASFIVSAYSINGKSEPGSSVSILFSDRNHQQIQKSVTTGPTGTFSETFNLSSLKDGTITITIQSSDPVKH